MTETPLHVPRFSLALAFYVSAISAAAIANAQLPFARHGEVVPHDVREIYDRGLQYLANAQTESGSWTGGETGPGATGLCLMVFLASGEDPNFGQYRNHVRRALRNIISRRAAQRVTWAKACTITASGCWRWPKRTEPWTTATCGRRGTPANNVRSARLWSWRSARRSRQKKNSLGAWRYSPDSTDADTSVSGAVLVGLLAARNAGIEVPDTSIDKAISFYTSMTSTSGQVAYAGGMGGFDESLARTSIATLVYAVARARTCRNTRPPCSN